MDFKNLSDPAITVASNLTVTLAMGMVALVSWALGDPSRIALWMTVGSALYTAFNIVRICRK